MVRFFSELEQQHKVKEGKSNAVVLNELRAKTNHDNNIKIEMIII